MTQLLHRIGRFGATRPWTVIGAWVVLAALVLAASATLGGKLQDTIEVPGLDSQQATDLLEQTGSDQAGLTAQLVVTPSAGATFDSSAARAALAELRSEAADLPDVISAAEPQLSPDRKVALVQLQYPPLTDLTKDDATALREFNDGLAENPTLRVELRGDVVQAFEEANNGAGEIIGLLLALAILLIAFGSIVAAALPIGVAVIGLAVGVGTMTLTANLTEVPTWAPVLGSMVGLGVGIDYALFILTRHREYLHDGVPVPEAIERAVAVAGRPVVFAGGIVVIAILGLNVSGVPFVSAGGLAVAIIVMAMMLVTITLLPALLRIAGTRVTGRRAARRTGLGWQRWTTHVTRHPRGYALGVTGILLALAAPVLAMQVGIPDDGTLPPSRTERQAYDLLADGFGAGSNGPLVIAVDTAGDPAVLGPLRTAIAADPGIAAVGPAAESNGVATLVAQATTGPQEQETRDTVARLRSEVIPAALAGSPATAHVGGQTAGFADIGERVNQRLPAFIIAVVAVSALLLMLVFRSVLIPLQAAAMNLLSIGASYGVMVMVFQWGWGAGLIGLEATVPIVSFIPMFMFALVFGLSMDYEVFLLSRIKEEYVASGDNHTAIVRGLSRSARVITSAAAIMVAVFLSFVVVDDPATKMFGLGLATAIAIDATLVRMVLVPALMTVFGDANWWAPRRLAARRPEPLVV